MRSLRSGTAAHMHEPLGTNARPRLTAFVLGLALALVGASWPATAQDTAPPANSKTVKAKKAAPKKAAKAKSPGKAKAKGKAAKSAPKKGAKALPESAKAPPLPRREPFTLTQKDRDIFTEAMRAVE